MPRSKKQQETRPFAPDSVAPFGAYRTAPFGSGSLRVAVGLSEAQQEIAQQIAAARDAHLSGDELRERFGSRLTGPARREIVRAIDRGDLVAPSYPAYRDADPRIGSRHAREHGAKAEARREAEAQAKAKAEAQAAFREQGEALREAGVRPSRSAAKRGEQFAALAAQAEREAGEYEAERSAAVLAEFATEARNDA